MYYKMRPLKSMPYAQARVREWNCGDVDLVSYETTVILVRDGWLECTGVYSKTTMRHIGKFMREFNFGDYFTARDLYKNNLKMNIYTGEVKSVLEP